MLAAWSHLSARIRLLILCGWPLLVGGIFVYLTWEDLAELGPDPTFESVSFLQRDGNDESLWAQIRKLEDDTVYELREAARLPEVQAEVERISAKWEVLRNMLPAKVQKGPMRKRLQDLAESIPSKEGEVRWVGMAIEVDEGARGRRGGAQSEQAVTYRVQVDADLNGLILYLWAIENNPDRFMAINRIDIKPGKVSADVKDMELDRELHQINLDIVTYVVPEDDPLNEVTRLSKQ